MKNKDFIYNIPKNYNPHEIEKKWQDFWERERIYAFDPYSDKNIYSIDTPPPTVSGKMHIGHAFSYSQMDFIARYHRMKGENVLCPFGTDDNGLPTELLIEKIYNIKSREMEREKFIELCLKTLEDIRPKFIEDWKKLGISADWNVFYSTIDEHCRKISQLSFIELYKKGRIYRKKAPFIWCPKCKTAIAQVEMKDEEVESELVYIKFETTINEDIIIATTRPELLGACVAIYVNPDDERYKKFLEKKAKAKLPIYNRYVDIIANEDVDMSFGSGVVYHCTFGDAKDVEWTQRFNTKIIEIINKDGKLNENAGKYYGMSIEEARKEIINDLQKIGAIVKKEKIKHIVNVHERCNTPIEFLTTEQWFIKYLDLKEKLLEYGKRLKWHPKHMFSRYENWVLGLKWDWCISRQRYFGVPFPLWYCKLCGNVILAEEDQLPVDPLKDKPKSNCSCGSKEFIPEQDVLDTWATSSLTPRIVAELFKDKPCYEKLIPMSLRPQAHDIISFWLFNTVVKFYLHENKIPWKDVMISGWALDPKGEKMSKSKGNVIEPSEVIEKYCVDCLRYWAASSKLGEDLRVQEKIFIEGMRFLNKLWNASRFVLFSLQRIEDLLEGNNFERIVKDFDIQKLSRIDKWLITKLSRTIERCTNAFENYEYSKAKKEAEEFFWKIFTDNYLEIVKDRIYNYDNYDKLELFSAFFTLYNSLLSIIKLFAPIVPHITEEIYQSYFIRFENEKSIHISKWPIRIAIFEDEEKLGDELIEIIAKIRKYKSENKLAMNAPLKKIIINKKFSIFEREIKTTMKIDEIEYKNEDVVEIVN
ncbi:MAG: valine--tRNA ligase [Candidatus Aenigmatarchaeota archaeon]